MAVRMMCDASKAGAPNVERVDNYPGAESWRLSHGFDCPHRNDPAFVRDRGPNCGEHCRPHGPLWMETTWVGCVTGLREMNGYDDSDFYASVWDDAAGCLREVMYATTRGWSYPNGAAVDATPEVLAKVAAWREAEAAAYRAAEAAAEAKFPSVGKTVKVVRGRKVAHGLVGEVFWVGKDKFKVARVRKYGNPMAEALGFHKWDAARYRVGLRLADGSKVFTAASNVEVVSV